MELVVTQKWVMKLFNIQKQSQFDQIASLLTFFVTSFAPHHSFVLTLPASQSQLFSYFTEFKPQNVDLMDALLFQP